MAVIITKQIRRRRTLLIASGALLITMALVLFLGLKKNTPAPTPTVDTGSSAVSVPTPPVSDSAVSDLKVGVFEDERFKVLQDPPGLPVESKTTGKPNPFSD